MLIGIRSSLWQTVLITVLLFTTSLAYADITGTVFRDFNGNGVKDTYEPLTPRVTVNAYNATGTLCATATSTGLSAPNYTLAGCGTDAVRVEFVLPNANNGCVAATEDFDALSGGVYGTSVQFVKGNSSNVNFALAHPKDYNTGSTNARVFVPRYVNGDPLAQGSTTGAADWFLGFPYTNTGYTAVTQKLVGTTIGATWGVAYSQQAGVLFTSALLKRHSGLGTLGSGGIYMLRPTATSFTASAFFDMDNNTFNTAANPVTRTRAVSGAYGEGASFTVSSGTQVTFLGATDSVSNAPQGLGVIGSNTERGLPKVDSASYDSAAFDQVGKVGLGDIDISDDGKYLFIMNLYARKLYRLELDDPTNPTAVNAIKAIDLPTMQCTNGVLRPFAAKYYRNKVYVGAVCSGENNGSNVINGTSDLKAYVFQLDDPKNTASFNTSPILSLPLNFQRGVASTVGAVSNQWFPWTNKSNSITPSGGLSVGRPTPILSNIDFNERGDLLLSFMDRTGHQYGELNYWNLNAAGGTTTGRIAVGGDLIIAGADCNGAYTLENNGKYTSTNGVNTGSGVGNAEGFGGGEFFAGDFLSPYHEETTQGTSIVLFGTGETMTTVMDPLRLVSGGVRRFSTNDASYGSSSYELYNSITYGDFAKANGLGELELLSVPSPIELGNRVWFDSNSNGIQDADEVGIAGVQVKLTCGANSATTVTAADGTYFFSNMTNGNASFISSGVKCSVNIPTGQAILANYTITKQNADNMTDNSPNTDIRDSDADYAETIYFTVGNVGENNHGLDIGYTPFVAKVDLKLAKTVSTPNAKPNEIVTYTLSVTNESTTDATDVQITDVLPERLVHLSDDGLGAYNTATGVWQVGNLAKGETKTLKLTVSVQ